jgi:hypothetical protein
MGLTADCHSMSFLRLCSYPARRFETIDLRQADLEQDDIGTHLRGLFHCFEAVARRRPRRMYADALTAASSRCSTTG